MDLLRRAKQLADKIVINQISML